MEAPSKGIVFITGIDGFTGNHLEAELVKQGFQVYGSTFKKPENPNHFQCNILEKEQLEVVFDKTKPAYVIHLAAISFVASENIPMMYETNIIGTLNVLDVLASAGFPIKKVLVASSAAVYGNIGNELSEQMMPRPVNHYGNSKLAMENMVANYFEKLNIIITRPFNYTGPGQEEHFLIPKIISHFKTKEEVIELGNTGTYREYNDVRFVCKLYVDLLKAQSVSETVNVGSGKTYSIKQILQTIEDLTNHNIRVEINPKFVRANEILELKSDTRNLKKILNRKSLGTYPLKETLESMLNA